MKMLLRSSALAAVVLAGYSAISTSSTPHGVLGQGGPAPQCICPAGALAK